MKKITKIFSLVLVTLLFGLFLVTNSNKVYAATPKLGNMLQNSEMTYAVNSTTISGWMMRVNNSGSGNGNHAVLQTSTTSDGLRKFKNASDSNQHNQYGMYKENYGLGARVYVTTFNSNSSLNSYVGFSQELIVRPNTNYTIEVVSAASYVNVNNANPLQIGAFTTNTLATAISQTARVKPTNRNEYTTTFTFFTGNRTTVYIGIKVYASNDNFNAHMNIKGVYTYLTSDYELQDDVALLFKDEAQTKLKYMTKAEFDSIYDSIRSSLDDPYSNLSSQARANIEAKLDLAKAQRDAIDDLHQRLDDLYTDNTESTLKASVDDALLNALLEDIVAISDTDYQTELYQRFDQAKNLYDLQNAKRQEIDKLDTLATKLIENIENLTFLSEDEKIAYISQINTTLNNQKQSIQNASVIEDVIENGQTGNSILTDIFLLAKQVDSKHELEFKKQELDAWVDGQTVDEQIKDDFKAQVQSMIDDAITEIQNATSVDDVEMIKTEELSDLNALKLELYKEISKDALDDKVEDLNVTDISVELQTIIDESKALIDDQTSLANVDQAKSEGLMAIELQVQKERRATSLETLVMSTKNTIVSYTELTQAEQDAFQDALDQMLIVGDQEILSALTMDDVDQAYNDWVLVINAKLLEAKKLNSKNDIDQKADEVKDALLNMTAISASHQTLLDEINQLQQSIDQKIDSRQSLINVEFERIEGRVALENKLLEIQKLNAVEILSQKADQVKTDALTITPPPSEAQLDLFMSRIDTILNSGTNAVNNSLNQNSIDLNAENYLYQLDNALTVLQNVSEESLASSKIDYDTYLRNKAANLIASIDGLTGLTETTKDLYKSVINDQLLQDGLQMISDATSIEEVRSFFDQYSTLMDDEAAKAILENEKALVKEFLDSRYVLAVVGLDLLPDISDKQMYIDALTDIINHAFDEIDDATTNQAVQQERQDTIALIDGLIFEAVKDAAINKVTTKATEVEALINQMTELTPNQKQTYLDEVQSILDTAHAVIEGTVNINYIDDIDQAVEQALIDLDNLLGDADTQNDTKLLASKLDYKDALNTKANEAKSFIDQLNHLSIQDKDLYKSLIDTLNQEGSQEIDRTTNSADMETIYNQRVTAIENVMLNGKKKDASNEIQNKIVELSGNGTLSVELQIAILEFLKEINDSTTFEHVDDAVADAKLRLDELFAEQLISSKERVKDELEAYAKQPITPEIQAIIDEKVALVTTSNFNKEDLIDGLITDGMVQIDAVYLNDQKDAAKSSMEDYLGTQRDAAVDALIDELVNEINETNFKDESFIDTLIEEFKAIVDAKNQVRDELTNHAPKPISAEDQAVIDEMVDAITRENHSEEDMIDAIDQGKAALDENKSSRNKSERLAELDAIYQSFRDSGFYKGSSLIELQETYEAARENLLNATDSNESKNLFEAGKLALESILIYETTSGEFSFDDLDFDSETGIYAGVKNPTGMVPGTYVKIDNIELENDSIELFKALLEAGKLNDLSKQEMYMKQKVLRQFDISLLSSDHIKITQFNGLYEVRILLEVNLRNEGNPQVFFMSEDGIEVFETARYGNWVSFKTTHFSHFYLSFIDTESKVVDTNTYNKLPGIILLLLVIIAFEITAILIKRQNNRMKLRSVNFVLPLLFIDLSREIGIPIIWILVIIIILLLIYLIYLFLIGKSESIVTENKTSTIVNEYYTTIVNHESVKDEKVEMTVVDDIIDSDDETVEPVTIDKTGLIIKYNYSFIARLHQAPLESQQRFSELKNYLLSFKDMKVKKSWKYERFMYKGKPIVKIWIHGKSLKLYFGIDPTKIDQQKYSIQDVSYAKMHEHTPSLFIIKGSRYLDYAKEIIDMIMGDEAIKQELPNINYTVKYISRDKLIEMKLIKKTMKILEGK